MALSRIFCCNPLLVLTAINITTRLSAIAVIPIFIIGPDTLLLYDFVSIIRLAIKNSNFKVQCD